MDFRQIGKKGEQVAANYLLAQGYRIIDANYFNHRGYRIGEVDLVTEDPAGTIVFVEVKSRVGNRGMVVPEENLTRRKIQLVIRAANHFLAHHGWLDRQWRIDSVAIIFDLKRKKLDIRHIKAIRL